MTIHLPLSFREVCDEIAHFTDLPLAEVEQRVWMEALMNGYNVVREGKAMGITPNVYDERMEQLYREGDGFIFETMTFWASPVRLSWIQQALERIHLHAQRQNLPASQLRIAIFGDGSGNDTLFLASHGLQVDYYDVPGSLTYAFASRRFAHYQVRERQVRLVTEYQSLLQGNYDVLLSFEVLEHLPDPVRAIRDMARMLKPDGIALITESFGVVSNNLPTHLACNLRYEGQTALLFAQAGMPETFTSGFTPGKPMEFTLKAGASLRDRMLAGWRSATQRRLTDPRAARSH